VRYAMRLSVGLVAIGIVGTVSAIQAERSNKAFSDHALRATAAPPAPSPRGQSYRGDLTFVAKDGHTVTIPATKVPTAVRDSFRAASSVEIQYLPEDPASVRFSNWDQPRSENLVLPVALLVAGLVAVGVLVKNRK